MNNLAVNTSVGNVNEFSYTFGEWVNIPEYVESKAYSRMEDNIQIIKEEEKEVKSNSGNGLNYISSRHSSQVGELMFKEMFGGKQTDVGLDEGVDFRYKGLTIDVKTRVYTSNVNWDKDDVIGLVNDKNLRSALANEQPDRYVFFEIDYKNRMIRYLYDLPPKAVKKYGVFSKNIGKGSVWFTTIKDYNEYRNVNNSYNSVPEL